MASRTLGVAWSAARLERLGVGDVLRDSMTMVYVDARHFAPSDPDFDASRLTLDLYTDDLEYVRSALGLERVVLIGHSVYGIFVTEYARRYPEHLHGLVVLASPPCAGPGLEQESERFWEADASPERKAVLQANEDKLQPEVLNSLEPSEVIPHVYVASGAMYWYDPSFDATRLWSEVHVNAPLCDLVFGPLLATYDNTNNPEPVRVPVLLVLGRYDYVVPYTLWDDRHRAALPRVTYRLFDGSGHSPQMEEAARFDAELTGWVANLTG